MCPADVTMQRSDPNLQTDMQCFPRYVGFIGRHLALYLHENNLASEIRLVDKVLPQLAWLAPEFDEACSKERFVQADASRERKLLFHAGHSTSVSCTDKLTVLFLFHLQSTSHGYSTGPTANNSTL